MPTKTATEQKTKITQAQAFRDVAFENGKLKEPLPSKEVIIKTVVKRTGTKTFTPARCSWYISQARAGNLSAGRSKAQSN